MSPRHHVLAQGEGTSYEWECDHVLVKTPCGMTEGRTTVVEDTLKPGFHLARHHHKAMAEVFVVLDGEVTFTFDDESIVASPGMTVNVPPMVWHEAETANGAKMLTVFSPGGFDNYLAEIVALEDKASDAAVMKELNERYDIWFA